MESTLGRTVTLMHWVFLSVIQTLFCLHYIFTSVLLGKSSQTLQN